MRRGFTLVELAIVMSLSAILVPAAFMFVRHLTARAELATFELEVATTLRAVAEQVELDAARPACATAKWTLDGEALTRTASAECGGAQVFARRVRSFERVAGGAAVVFGLRVSPELTVTREVFVPGRLP